MHVIECPYCGKEVKIVRFGFSWVGVCCMRIVYDNENLPKNAPDEIKNKSHSGETHTK